MLRQIRWAVLFLSVGCVLGFVGGCYYLHEASYPSAIATLIGVPMALGGLALKGSELAPVAITAIASPDVIKLRSQATPTQVQILEDATRYQYGASVHLETAMEKIGLESTESDDHPVLVGIREANINDAYGLVLEFNPIDIPFEIWQDKEDKMMRFFGPNVAVKATQISPKRVEVEIVKAIPAPIESPAEPAL
jgi:Protein of unknown function (DUF2854)